MICKKIAKTPTWGLHNSTKYYVLIVDGYFGYFENTEDMEVVRKKADDQFSLCHGDINWLSPNTPAHKNIAGEMSKDIICYQPIDITNYVFSRVSRIKKRHDVKMADKLKHNNLPSRFVYWKTRDEVVPGFVDIDWDNISLCTVDGIWKRTVHGVDFNKYCYDDGYSILIGG